jgi:hypothetical protein
MNKVKCNLQTSSTTESQLTHSDLEKYLILPSGISALKAKSIAKDIVKAHKRLNPEQPLQYNFALRMVYCSNGLPQVKDVSQALNILLKDNFGCELSQLKLYTSNNKIVRFKLLNPSGYSFELHNRNGMNREEFISEVVPFLKSQINSQKKAKKFLATIKQAVIYIDNECGLYSSFYNLSPGKTIQEVNKLSDISINVEQLLNSDSEELFTLRYALASCYNTKHTVDVLLKKSVINFRNYTGKDTLYLAHDDEYLELNDFLDLKSQFGGLCYASDSRSNRLIQALLENYCGW